MSNRLKLAFALAFLTVLPALAVNTKFTDFTPLTSSATGNVYIIEDRNGGSDDDIWFAADWNKDGDLLDEGEGLARWMSNGAVGSEFTGLYFDLRNPNRAFVNIQHPDSDVDRTIEITTQPNFERGNK